MQIAKEYKLKPIAFPAISCGVYGFPIHRACDIRGHHNIKKTIIKKLSEIIHNHVPDNRGMLHRDLFPLHVTCLLRES